MVSSAPTCWRDDGTTVMPCFARRQRRAIVAVADCGEVLHSQCATVMPGSAPLLPGDYGGCCHTPLASTFLLVSLMFCNPRQSKLPLVSLTVTVQLCAQR